MIRRSSLLTSLTILALLVSLGVGLSAASNVGAPLENPCDCACEFCEEVTENDELEEFGYLGCDFLYCDVYDPQGEYCGVRCQYVACPDLYWGCTIVSD